MAELDLLSLMERGPFIFIVVFLMWFTTVKAWPWYIDVYQVEQNRRWDIKQTQDNRVQEHANQLSAMVMDITKEYQNGSKAAMVEGFDRIARLLDRSFGRQDTHIEGWMTATAAMVEIVAQRSVEVDDD